MTAQMCSDVMYVLRQAVGMTFTETANSSILKVWFLTEHRW